MKYILATLILVCNSAFSQVVVTQFNADWNSANDVEWFQKLNDCDLAKVDIVKETKLQEKHKIVIVPTIIIFNQGSKEKVFKAGLDLLLPTDLNEIQESITEINKASKF